MPCRPLRRPLRRPLSRTGHLPRRTVQLLVGLVLYAASIAAMVRSGLGNMPWDVLSQGASRQTGWSFGALTVLISLLVLLCWIPLRQRPGIGTVANVLVIGALVDPFLAVLGRLPDPLPLWAAVALAVGGIVVNGLATALYIGARMGPGPRDGLMTGLVRRTGRSVGVVRTSIEVVVVAVGWLLGGTFGAATVAYAVGIGPIVHMLLPRLTVPMTTGQARATRVARPSPLSRPSQPSRRRGRADAPPLAAPSAEHADAPAEAPSATVTPGATTA